MQGLAVSIPSAPPAATATHSRVSPAGTLLQALAATEEAHAASIRRSIQDYNLGQQELITFITWMVARTVRVLEGVENINLPQGLSQLLTDILTSALLLLSNGLTP